MFDLITSLIALLIMLGYLILPLVALYYLIKWLRKK